MADDHPAKERVDLTVPTAAAMALGDANLPTRQAEFEPIPHRFVVDAARCGSNAIVSAQSARPNCQALPAESLSPHLQFLEDPSVRTEGNQLHAN
jgi:hypothetical protein